MRRALALLVPLLFALALVAAAFAGGSAAQSVPDDGTPLLVGNYENASNYLTMAPEQVTATDTVTVGMDAGLAAGMDGRALQNSHRLETFRQRFDAAESDADRAGAYHATLTAIENRTDTLEARNAATIRGYANGTLSANSFLRERAVIGAEASRLRAIVDELAAVERETLGFELSNRNEFLIQSLTGRLVALQGPISDRTARLASGGGQPRSVYVESSTSGYVLAFVDDNRYVRETYLGDEYAPDQSDQFESADGDAIQNALNRATELYPTTTSEGIGGFGSTTIYQYNGEFDHGQVTVYLDGGTGNAFREDQRVNLSSLPTGEPLTTTNGTVTLRVNRTFETGPMQISVVDSQTGTPVDGTVSVNDRVVGDLSESASVWAVEPRGSVTVYASTPEANLSLSLETAEPTVQGG